MLACLHACMRVCAFVRVCVRACDIPCVLPRLHLPMCCRSSEQLLIQWAANGRTKWVKRLNLILQDEDSATFRCRLLQAQRRRYEVCACLHAAVGAGLRLVLSIKHTG